MALVDELTIYMKAGKGGDGVVRWIHEKFREYGGPGGGNGGKGGSVIACAVKDSWLLARYRHTKSFEATDGQQGGNHRMTGADGADLTVELPVGSIIRNLKTGEEVRLDTVGQTEVLLKGGHGGLGNDTFKSSTNQTPKQSTKGKPGEDAEFYIEVELIADAGFIGLPNAGKSSLLNALTHADAKVGNYQFTTLEPNLGDLYGNILADIPGLIEGASEGKGLGHKFLRHIKRTKMLMHCISCEHALDLTSESGTEFDAKKGVNAAADVYMTIRNELQNFDDSLAEKDEILLFTKTDVLNSDQLEKFKKEITKHKAFKSHADEDRIRYVTVLDDNEVKALSQFILKILG